MSVVYDQFKAIPEPVRNSIFGKGQPINPINILPLPQSLKANYLGPMNDLSDEYIAKHPPLNVPDELSYIHDWKYHKSEKEKDPNEKTLIQRGADLRMVKDLDDWKSRGWFRGLHPQYLLGRTGIASKMFVEDMMGKAPTHKGKVVNRYHDVIPGYKKGGTIKPKPGREKQTVMVHQGEIIKLPDAKIKRRIAR